VRTLNLAFAKKKNNVHYAMSSGFGFFQLCSVQVENIFPFLINLLEALNEPLSSLHKDLEHDRLYIEIPSLLPSHPSIARKAVHKSNAYRMTEYSYMPSIKSVFERICGDKMLTDICVNKLPSALSSSAT
jgi:hypothetical protein